MKTQVIRFACCPRDRFNIAQIANPSESASIEDAIISGAKIALGCPSCLVKCKRIEIRYAPKKIEEREVEECQTR